MKQNSYNLLGELALMHYEEARTMNMLPNGSADEDPAVQRDTDMKKRMHLLTAWILSDILYHGGEHISEMLEDGAAKGLTLYRCDIAENLARIMPPPPAN